MPFGDHMVGGRNDAPRAAQIPFLAFRHSGEDRAIQEHFSPGVWVEASQRTVTRME